MFLDALLSEPGRWLLVTLALVVEVFGFVSGLLLGLGVGQWEAMWGFSSLAAFALCVLAISPARETRS